MVKNPAANAGFSGLIPDPGTKIPHAAGQLSPAAKVLKATCSGARMSQLENPWATIKDHTCYNKDPTCCNSRPDTAREINQKCFINALYVPGFPCGSAGKESTCNEGDLGSIPGLVMATCSCILTWRSPMDRGAWRAVVHKVEKSHIRLKQLSMHMSVIRLVL